MIDIHLPQVLEVFIAVALFGMGALFVVIGRLWYKHTPFAWAMALVGVAVMVASFLIK